MSGEIRSFFRLIFELIVQSKVEISAQEYSKTSLFETFSRKYNQMSLRSPVKITIRVFYSENMTCVTKFSITFANYEVESHSAKVIKNLAGQVIFYEQTIIVIFTADKVLFDCTFSKSFK